jgi:hypothetical protein
MQNALKAGKRVAEATVGPSANETASIHPPTAVMTLHLSTLQVPGVGSRNFEMPTAIGCTATTAFGSNFSAPQCSSITAEGIRASDGTLPAYSTVPPNPTAFGDKFKVRHMLVLGSVVCTFCVHTKSIFQNDVR